MNVFLDQLRVRAIRGGVRTILFPEADDARVQEAATRLSQEKIVQPMFVEIEERRAEDIQHLLLERRSSKVGTPDELTSEKAQQLAHDPLWYTMDMLRRGEADGLVAGAVRTTADVLRAGLWLVGKADGIQTVSSAMYMVVGDQVLTFADCAVVPNPTPDQLADIAIASADARRAVVGDEPRVAMLSYSTKGSGRGSSVDTVRKALEIVQARRPQLMVDGELQADAAIVESISQRKAPGNIINGQANVLVFPSLDAANIAYKLVVTLVPGAQALGPILQGMKKPMSDLSRGARVQDIVDVATIVAAQAAGSFFTVIPDLIGNPENDRGSSGQARG